MLNLFSLTQSPCFEQEDVKFSVYCSVIVPCLSGCHFHLRSSVILFTWCNDLVEYSTCVICALCMIHITLMCNDSMLYVYMLDLLQLYRNHLNLIM
jgi:hypothetical protein